MFNIVQVEEKKSIFALLALQKNYKIGKAHKEYIVLIITG